MSELKIVKYRVYHCSATLPHQDIGVKEITEMHKKKGWSTIGYHVVVRLDGTPEFGRSFQVSGAHVKGYNWESLGICYVGGLNALGQPADTRTPEQKKTLIMIDNLLAHIYPRSIAKGHRDFSPDLDGDGIIEPNEFIKECPCFDVATEFYI